MKEKASALAPFAKSKTKAKAEARRLAMPELEKLIAALKEVQATEKSKAKKKEDQKRQANIKKAKALLAEAGLKPEDLKTTAGKTKKAARKTAKRKVPPRYRLVIDGEEHLWSGRGRTPKVFQEYLAQGNAKEDCEIQPTS